MYPLVRLFRSAILSPSRAPLRVNEQSYFDFYVRPWDIDMFLELNNGRLLTLFDLGRFDLAGRCGLGRVLKAKRWGLVVAGSTTRYRKRIRLFDRVTIATKLVAVDERWFYIEQTALVKDQACASALLRTAVTKNGRLHPTEDVAIAMNVDLSEQPPSGWNADWINLEDERPWPPS